MQPYLIEAYAAILESEQAITFEHDNTIYRIWWSDSGEGWYLELLEENNELWNAELTATEDAWTEFDGGMCTGSARDAIEFMLPAELPPEAAKSPFNERIAESCPSCMSGDVEHEAGECDRFICGNCGTKWTTATVGG